MYHSFNHVGGIIRKAAINWKIGIKMKETEKKKLRKKMRKTYECKRRIAIHGGHKSAAIASRISLGHD